MTATTSTVGPASPLSAASLLKQIKDFGQRLATVASAPLRIVESEALVETVEDWSRVRSPSRARRRRAKHRQNIRLIEVPRRGALVVDGVAYMHPTEAAKLRRMTERRGK
ncbi:MAG: hypothetical protein KDJ44_09235 [Rhodoblastus sp.]|nr:hypothetical protein [Rhodoblastus sp.]